VKDLDGYYSQPDHGHRKENEYPASLQYGLLAASVAISALSAYLMGAI